MSAPSFSHERDWRELADTGVSQRATTSSRHPGVVFEGSITHALHRIVDCAQCGRPRRESRHPHAPTSRLVDGAWRVVDCAGVEVTQP